MALLSDPSEEPDRPPRPRPRLYDEDEDWLETLTRVEPNWGRDAPPGSAQFQARLEHLRLAGIKAEVEERQLAVAERRLDVQRRRQENKDHRLRSEQRHIRRVAWTVAVTCLALATAVSFVGGWPSPVEQLGDDLLQRVGLPHPADDQQSPSPSRLP